MGQEPRVSIVLPTYNERETIQGTIQSIFEHVQDSVEIIVVDDDSPDETWRVVGELGDPRVKLIRRVGVQGLASSLTRGLMETRGEIVGWMDADMSHPPSLLPDMIEKLKEYDVVIASRFVPGGSDERGALRVFASRLINGLALLVLGYGIKDYDSGYILMRRSVFDKALVIPLGYGHYFIEFVYTCCKRGLSVYELPFVFRERERGTSKSMTSLVQFLWAGMGYVVRIFVARLRTK